MSNARIRKKSEKQIATEKSNRILEGVAYWGSFYRCNPHRFAKDYLNIISLKPFQKILLFAMMSNNFFMYIAARGQGKRNIQFQFHFLYQGVINQ